MKAFDEGNIRSTVDDLLTAENTDWFRLGFNSAPFMDDQDAAYFAIDSWDEAFQVSEHFCDAQDPLLVIPSIPGSGKTTFVSQFIAKQDAPAQIHYLKARSIFSLRNLLNAISENFPQFSNLTTNTENFINDLRTAAQEAGPQLLIIDDAQRLSKESLAGLLQILASQDLSDLWLRVVLCGEPQLEDRVQSLFDELAFSFTFNNIILEPLDLNEARAYLKHRMDEAGYKEKFPFNKSMVKHIHTLSSGFPGRINRVAQQVLLDMAKNNQFSGASVQSSSNGAGLSKHKVKMISMSLVVFLALVLWYLQQTSAPLALHQETYTTPIAQRFIDRPAQVQTHQARANELAQAVNNTAKNGDILLSEQRMLRTASRNHAANANQVRTKLPQPAQSQATGTIASAGTTSQQARGAIATTVTTAIPNAKQASIVQSTADIPASTQRAKPLPAQSETTVSLQKTTVQTANPVQSNLKNLTGTQAIESSAVVSTAKAPQLKPKSAVAPATQPAATLSTKSAANRAIQTMGQQQTLNKNDTGFTLQLLGVHDQAKLVDYIKQMHLGTKAAYFKTQLGGTPWYVLVFGTFKTADEAHAAIKTLPAQVQAQKPWVKSLSAIHTPLIR